MKHPVVEYALVMIVAAAGIFLVIAGLGVGMEALTHHIQVALNGG